MLQDGRKGARRGPQEGLRRASAQRNLPQKGPSETALEEEEDDDDEEAGVGGRFREGRRLRQRRTISELTFTPAHRMQITILLGAPGKSNSFNSTAEKKGVNVFT